MSQTTFSKIDEARQALIAAGFRFNGYGAITSAEGWQKDGKVVFIRRQNGRVVVR